MVGGIILAVILVVSGAAAYGIFSVTTPSSGNVTTCSPSCAPSSNVNDVTLFVPLKSAQQNSTLPFTATVPAGENPTQYRFDFGDGNNTTSGAPTVDHRYASPGNYLASATALVDGVTHYSYKQLVPITVTTSFASIGSGNVPGVSGSVTANGSSATNPTVVLTSGETLTVAGSYTAAPTNPAWTLALPKMIVSPGGTIHQNSSTLVGATAQVSFVSSGPHTVSFVGVSSGPSGAIAHQLYVWTVFVVPPGVPVGIQGGSGRASPHSGEIIAYENTPGGTYTSDPAIDYDIVGFEILINVYETLVFYNGSQTGPTSGGFVPVIATCVPGSAQCQSLYGNTLVSGSNYTFVISPTAHFYDPATQKSWPVYPTDVLFSIARTEAFATLPCVTCNNGWILTQSLLSAGNTTWDSPHGTYNNTPLNVLNTMTLNESGVCTAAMMTAANGCVTFHASGSGLSWPYFLQLIGDTEGGGIVPCGWFSAPAQGAGIPYWTLGNVSGAGDHPCQAPGVAGYGVAPSAMPAKGWDNWESAASTPPFVGNVQNNMVGSGPYYMYNYIPGLSYTLRANPAYQANPQCTWSTCYPKPSQFAPEVSVYWEPGPVQGEQAMQAGIADYAGIPSSDFAFLLQMIEAGQASVLSIPTINIYFFPFVLAFSPSETTKYSSNPLNVPKDWFSYVGMRQFFIHSYPYATIQATVNTKVGLQIGFPFGGAIPQFLGNYYPTSVNWPSTDPCADASNPTCPAYWWAQITNPSSPYYDLETAACTTSSPCQFPLFGVTGDPDTDQRLSLWIHGIITASGGRVVPSIADIEEAAIVVGQYSAPYTNFETAYAIRWVPDYPDPTDYVRPMYQPDTTYTYSGAVAEQLGIAPFNSTSGCPGTATDYATYAALTLPVSNACQGVAYWAMQRALTIAAPLPDNAMRVQLYAQAEAIANQLALYIYEYQQELVPALGPWIDPGSFNTNPIIGAGGDTPWFWITGNGVA